MLAGDGQIGKLKGGIDPADFDFEITQLPNYPITQFSVVKTTLQARMISH
jgi:hypothetical protein